MLCCVCLRAALLPCQVREVLEDGVLEVTGECPTSNVGGLWPRWMLEETDSDLDLRNNRCVWGVWGGGGGAGYGGLAEEPLTCWAACLSSGHSQSYKHRCHTQACWLHHLHELPAGCWVVQNVSVGVSHLVIGPQQLCVCLLFILWVCWSCSDCVNSSRFTPLL
jgi:hypothetical protein